MEKDAKYAGVRLVLERIAEAAEDGQRGTTNYANDRLKFIAELTVVGFRRLDKQKSKLIRDG